MEDILGTRKPLGAMLGSGPLSCGARIGFLPDPPEGGTTATTPPAAPAGQPAPDADVVTMTRAEYQAQLSKVGAKEKDHGVRSGASELARSLGFDSPDALTELVRRHQDAERAQMSEVERAKAEAEADRAQAHKALVEAKQARFDARAQSALVAAGSQDPELDAPGLMRLGVTVESTDEEIRAAVERMRERKPGGFGAGQNGTPASDSGRPPAGSPAGSGNGQGQLGQLAKQQQERYLNRRGGGRIA